ncbi:MAG: transposase [Elusimicrobia bacterium]|nr:transposase [Elusimicrobiota bacterium]
MAKALAPPQRPWRKRDRKGGRPRRSSRLCFDALLWHLSSGEPWASLPERFGSPRTVQRRLKEWEGSGDLATAWGRYLETLAPADIRVWRGSVENRPGKRTGWWYWELLGVLAGFAAVSPETSAEEC